MLIQKEQKSLPLVTNSVTNVAAANRKLAKKIKIKRGYPISKIPVINDREIVILDNIVWSGYDSHRS